MRLSADVSRFDRRRLGILLAPVQLIASHRVGRDPCHRPAAEETPQVFDTRPGRVRRPIALQDIVFQVRARHHVKRFTLTLRRARCSEVVLALI
jgi:hypothetical protein